MLLALVGTASDGPVGGAEVTRRLEAAGRPVRADRLLRFLLDLERAGHAQVSRGAGYAFALTDAGEAAAYGVGAGRPVDLLVVMVDLVDFVAFTDREGDDAGLHAATQLAQVTTEELGRRGGRVVKHLGDGVLGSLPVEADAVDLVAAIARRCLRPDGTPWPLRASARLGRPILLAGDLYGTDVNLASRLCGTARPGEIVLSGFGPVAHVDAVEVRGVSTVVPITRVPIP